MYDEHIKKCIINLSEMPSKDELKFVVDKFINHKRIIFCTMGKSAYACRKVVYTARSYGLDWHDLDVCHAFHGDMGIVRNGDLLVFVSKSGETRETLRVAKHFSNWETVGISSGENSSLSSICRDNITIPIKEEASPFGYAPMVSTTMYMIVLHAIMCEVIETTNITMKDYARNHPDGDIGRKIRLELQK